MSPQRQVRLLPPRVDVSYTLDEIFIENKPHERPPVEYWLFMDRVIRKQRRRFVHEISAASQAQADAELRAIADRNDVTLVDEKSGRRISKDWQKVEASA